MNGVDVVELVIDLVDVDLDVDLADVDLDVDLVDVDLVDADLDDQSDRQCDRPSDRLSEIFELFQILKSRFDALDRLYRPDRANNSF